MIIQDIKPSGDRGVISTVYIMSWLGMRQNWKRDNTFMNDVLGLVAYARNYENETVIVIIF